MTWGFFLENMIMIPHAFLLELSYTKTQTPKEDQESVLSNTFPGSLLIGGNIINDNRRITVLEKLPNILVTTMNMKLATYNRLLGGDIIYGENVIRLRFDSKTDELTEVFIHHNFKDR